MLDAAIEIGIGAFLAGQEQGDAEVEEALRARGLEPWLVARLILFVPLAIGREMLPDCELHRMFAADGVGRLLTDDPVWVAAARRAKRATRNERMAIGRRSSEVAAVSQFLEQYPERHGELGKLTFSMPTIGVALPEVQPGDGGAPSPTLAFRKFLEGHGRAVYEREGHELMETGPLRFGARVYPRASRWAQVQVDFVVAHPALAVPQLLESFAGFAETWSDALKQTIVKFERSSLHVLIAGLLDRGECADQVEWEPLGDSQGRFEVCMGGQLQTFGSGKAPLLGAFIDELKAALREVPLTRAAHGLRVFLAWDGKALNVVEVLLDNEAWAPGEQLAAARDWSGAGGAEETWGVRWFGLVVPVRKVGEAEAAEKRRLVRGVGGVGREAGAEPQSTVRRDGDEDDADDLVLVDSDDISDAHVELDGGSDSISDSGDDSSSGGWFGSDED